MAREERWVPEGYLCRFWCYVFKTLSRFILCSEGEMEESGRLERRVSAEHRRDQMYVREADAGSNNPTLSYMSVFHVFIIFKHNWNVCSFCVWM